MSAINILTSFYLDINRLNIDRLNVFLYKLIMFKITKSTQSQNKKPIELFHNQIFTGKTILIIGGFHGDEPQGVKILKKALTKNFKTKNSIYILPCLNPDGLAKKTRVNANNVDLNRNFATKNWKFSNQDEFFGGKAPASELETQFLSNVINEIQPDIILSLHAPFKIVNYDGNAENICIPIAKIMNYPIENDIGYPTPGSFGTYCGIERNIPTITLELGEDESEKWQLEKVLDVIDYLSNLD